MPAQQPNLDSFVAAISDIESSVESRPFDRMMFDVCGEVNHVCAAFENHTDSFSDALRALDRSCNRIYADPNVGLQRKYSLRVAEWILKSWCVWEAPTTTRQIATRWFDAWQRERNMALLQL